MLNRIFGGIQLSMSEAVNDKDQLELLKSNDTATWEYLIRIYFPVLCRFAGRIMGYGPDAEDIVSDVLVRTWHQSTGFKDMLQLKKYLYTSVRNACLNSLRSRKREKSRHETFVNTYLADDNQIEKELIYSELLAEIRKEIDSLPTRMRQIFILSYYRKMANDEISAYLQLSQQTVRNQKSTALSQIRKALKDRYPELVIMLILNLGE